MSDLSTEQLTELTTRVNARFAEFDFQFEERRRGEVRLIYDVITEWIERDTSEKWRAWALGYARGVEETVAEYAPPAEDDAWEGDRGAPKGHPRRFGAVTPKGRAFAINGDPNMSEETAAALGAMMDAVCEKLTQHQAEPPKPDGGHAVGDPLGDVYHAGFMRGREAGRQEAGSADAAQGPRQVTHSAPIDDPPAGDPPPDSGANLIDISELTAAWPDLADQPDGADVFPDLPVAGTISAATSEPDPPAPLPPTINTNGHVAVAIISKPRTPSTADSDRAARHAELEAVVDTLRGIAVDGEMPTVAQYDAARRGDCLGWVTLSKRHGLTWADLARKAGLRYTRQGSLEREVKELRERKARHDAQRQVTYDEFVAEIRRIAMGGAMPTHRQFDESKPAVWPTATALVMRFHTSWEEVADACGLDYQRGRKTAKAAA